MELCEGGLRKTSTQCQELQFTSSVLSNAQVVKGEASTNSEEKNELLFPPISSPFPLYH